MADTLKEFSSSTAITYDTLIGDGHTLASTTGSQKAVIKDISISNANRRTLDVKLGTGVGVSSTNNSIDTLSGNFILDNSNSLKLSTNDKCSITDFRQTGWGNGDDMTQNDFVKWGDIGTQFGDFGWTGTIEGMLTDQNNNHPWGGTVTELGFNITNPSYSFVANGRWYWVHKRTSGNYGTNTMRSTPAPGTGSSDIRTYGSNKAMVMAYDGNRYIYTLGDSDTALRKYDTTTLGSSDTYTTVNLLQPDSSSALTWRGSTYPCGYFYRDGYILVNGSTGQTGTYEQSGPMIISVATGKTKMIYDPFRTSSYFGNVTMPYQRRALGIAKDSKGTYWAMISNVYVYQNDSDGRNSVCICSLGSDIENDFLASGKTYGSPRIHRLLDHDPSSAYNSNAQRRIGQIMCQSGYHFGNPSGPLMHTPGMIGKLATNYVTYYSDGNTSRSGLTEQDYSQVLFDFDNATADTSDFMKVKGRGNQRPHKGEISGYVDAAGASGGFGTIKARTSGILIT